MTPFSAVNDVSSTREARLQDGCEYNFCGAGGAFLGVIWRDRRNPYSRRLGRVRGFLLPGAIGLLCVLIWLILRPHSSGLTKRRLWFWSVIAGVGVGGNFSFYFLSIAHGSVAVAATLMYSAPVFVYLVSFALRLESPTPLKWAAIAVVILGVVLLDVGASGVTAMGVGAGLLAGLSYAIFIYGFKYAAPHGSPQAILSIALMVLASILIWPSDVGQTVAVLSTPDWPLFEVLGVLGAGLSFVLYIIG